jgi:hypothetical protein
MITVENYQQMLMANDLFPLFSQGRKRVTCRQGRRDIQLAHLMFVSTDPVEVNEDWNVYCNHLQGVHMCQLVDVTEVKYKRLFYVTDIEAQEDGFADITSMLQGMRRFYPSLHLGSEMTFVHFKVV